MRRMCAPNGLVPAPEKVRNHSYSRRRRSGVEYFARCVFKISRERGRQRGHQHVAIRADGTEQSVDDRVSSTVHLPEAAKRTVAHDRITRYDASLAQGMENVALSDRLDNHAAQPPECYSASEECMDIENDYGIQIAIYNRNATQIAHEFLEMCLCVLF